MFGFSLATQIFQGSTQRTWNCVSRLANLLWNKFVHYKEGGMPRSRKRHHSRSRSRSRSLSVERNFDKHKKNDSNEKDGKRRRLDDVESPQHKRSLSAETNITTDGPKTDIEPQPNNIENREKVADITETVTDLTEDSVEQNDESLAQDADGAESGNDSEKVDESNPSILDTKKDTMATPKNNLTPKQIQKRLESEKKRQQRQKEKEDREKQKQEEKERILAEKQKLKQQKEVEKQKQLEIKQKEKELKDEQKRKEREEKEQKRKEKEEKEEQKRKERELEKQKRQQEIDEKNKEKMKEEEKKQKSAALFANFFKKTDKESAEKEKKVEKTNSAFMPFEVKSDMRLAPVRRNALTEDSLQNLDSFLETQNKDASYLNDLKNGIIKPNKSSKTWTYEEGDNDVILVEDDKNLGETICGNSNNRKLRAKFFFFHENRRPPYFGTWRKKSVLIKPRKPFIEDAKYFNYEEDSDDDWEDEEQGESLDASGDEEDKDAENDQDDYEVDNDFFVPHGHLSEDEMDDEQDAKLSPETLKQKLKLLKDEFDEDMKSKTHKLKPRSIGCIWMRKDNGDIDQAILRYLEPFAVLVNGPIEIKPRSEIFTASPERKKYKPVQELPSEHVALFMELIHGNVNKKKILIEEFLALMANKNWPVEVSKAHLIRLLKQSATFKRYKEKGPLKNKFVWFVNEDIRDKYGIQAELISKEKL